MREMTDNILVWLPSPMGDAILSTPALRAIRKYFKSSIITFLANPVVQQVLSPSNFNDRWLNLDDRNLFALAKKLKTYNFTHAILLKNSFASALTVFLARIPSRIGYARQGRGYLLTERLSPPRLANGKFKPLSMVDYYLAIASWLGADTLGRSLELLVDPGEHNKLKNKLPEVTNCTEPLVIIVPGGAYGPSKFWLPDRFAKTADWLIDNYRATIVISSAPNPEEAKIAKQVCTSSNHRFINLSEKPLSLVELKALFSIADLVITNDTGPRHIAIALKRKVITLFGPNDPAWTDTGYENEIQIVGDVPCSPCTRPTCKESEHFCMQAITVEMVCDTAKKLLGNNRILNTNRNQQEFVKISKSMFIDVDYETPLRNLGLNSIDSVFSFNIAKNLTKAGLAPFRTRLQFEIDYPGTQILTTAFLKRYDRPPIMLQLRNWLSHHAHRSCALSEVKAHNKLSAAGINTPRVISYGQQWGILFEKRSFIISEKIPNAQSLERKLPGYFEGPATTDQLKLRRDFIDQLAKFVRKFHQTNYRHRDFYFSHIFYGNNGNFYLIDLARAFKPIICKDRFRIKDIAQIHYSAPAKYFSRTDRLRFYCCYASKKRLTQSDKVFIRKVQRKAECMARHDTKHGRTTPFTKVANHN
jgi:heptosyltransferase-2